MASARSRNFVQAVKKSLEATAAAGTAGGSYMQDQGTTKDTKITGTAVEFVANQLDVAIELVEASGKKGRLDKATLNLLLLKKGLAFGDLIPVDSVQCMSALVSLGIGLGRFAVLAPTGAGAVWQGAILLSDFYATYVDCKDPFNKTTEAGMNQMNRFMFQLENEIYQLYGVPRF